MKPEDMRMARAALNWSLEQLAQASEVHRNTISNFETGKFAGDPAKLAAIKRTLESAGVIFPADTEENSSVKLRRFQVGDVVRFRPQSRMRGSYDIATDELGTVVGVEPHPPQTGPTYRIEIQFERVRVPYIFKFEYELVRAAEIRHVTKIHNDVTKITPDVSTNDVEAFCKFCVSLRSIFCHFQILFKDGTDLRRELLQSIAPTFFKDMNEMLIDHLILKICTITEPEENFGRKNLTVTFLVNKSDFSTAPGEFEELKRRSDSMHVFRAKIVPARNRLIGHLDRHSVLDGKALGGADEGEWDQFWLDLQTVLQILHKHYIDPAGHFYLIDIGCLSDADSLIKALKESTYFHTMLRDRTLVQKCADVAYTSKYYEA